MNSPEFEFYRENKTHTSSQFPYNTYICTIPLDFHEVMNHWHEEMEIIYIKKGYGIVSLDLSDYTVKGGDILVVLPRQLHGIRQLHSEKMEYENIIFKTDMLFGRFSDSLDEDYIKALLNHELVFAPLLTPELTYYNEISECLNEADRICSTFPKGYPLAIKGLLYRFFYILYTHSDQPLAQVERKNMDRIKFILQYIEKHYDRPITIDEIAKEAGFSSSHFMTFFKHEMGTSFISYLNHYRLSKAAGYLASTDEPILSIAESCGFDNLSYFNRIFKKRYGCTPGAYRKLH